MWYLLLYSWQKRKTEKLGLKNKVSISSLTKVEIKNFLKMKLQKSQTLRNAHTPRASYNTMVALTYNILGHRAGALAIPTPALPITVIDFSKTHLLTVRQGVALTSQRGLAASPLYFMAKSKI